jgi:predicted oxidoreductase
VRKAWPRDRLGEPPREMIAGVPAHVDGRMIAITEAAGGRTINADRMWHYTEGVKNWNPIWPDHGIRILPGPSSMWFDADRQPAEAALHAGFRYPVDAREILSTGHDHSWFIMTQKILKKEVALSGSEQNPDFASKSWLKVIRQRLLNKQGHAGGGGFQAAWRRFHCCQYPGGPGRGDEPEGRRSHRSREGAGADRCA